MWVFAPLCAIAAMMLTGCRVVEADRRPAVSDVRFDELSGDVWAFERRVRGRAPEGCVTVAIKRGPILLRVPVREGRFSAVVPLAPGENVVGAYCADPGEASRDARIVYRVPLPAAPRASVRLVVLDDSIVLDGAASAPNPGTHAPLRTFEWSGDPANSAPLMTPLGRALDDARGRRLVLAVPPRDGEYVVWLTVRDATMRDRAGIAFIVERGEVRRVDRSREAPGWLDEAVVYEVAPVLFGDPVFDSVRRRLPRLAELGVNTLLVRPVYEATGAGAAHDHFRVRSAWGTKASFRALVDAAHQLGLRVILDFAPSGVSGEHPYFAHASLHRARSPYWTLFERTPELLPRLDYDNPDVRRFMLEALAFWVREFGVDGFRLANAWELGERAPGFVSALRDALVRIEPNLLLIAGANAPRPLIAGFDAVSREPFIGGPDALSSLDVRAGLRVLRVLDTHALPGPERVASALLFTAPGIPGLFTGQEVGARYAGRHQPLAFAPDAERFARYRRLATLRAREEALRSGPVLALEVVGAPGVHAFARMPSEGGRSIVVVLAFSPTPTRARVRLAPALRGRRVEALFGDGAARVVGGELLLRVEGYDARVFAFE